MNCIGLLRLFSNMPSSMCSVSSLGFVAFHCFGVSRFLRFKKLAVFRLTELCIVSYSFQCVLVLVTDTSLVTCLVNLLK